jgi:hypothetical protein
MTYHPATSQTAPSPLRPFTRFGVIACKSPACFERTACKTLLQSRCLNPATSIPGAGAHNATPTRSNTWSRTAWCYLSCAAGANTKALFSLPT